MNNIPLNRATLMTAAQPYNYFTKTADVVITKTDSSSEITITGQGRRFWITDIVPLAIECTTGKIITDRFEKAMDDIRVHIVVCNKEMTERPIPLLSLMNKNNELFAGKILEPNDSVTFRFECRNLPNQSVAKGQYPILVAMTLKGYEITA
jgi:hypothetical protein